MEGVLFGRRPAMSREQHQKSRITLSQAYLVELCPVGQILLVFEALHCMEVIRSAASRQILVIGTFLLVF